MATQESILRILIDSRNAERNANSLNRELRSIERNGDFASTSMDSMSRASRSLAASLASIVTVGAAISKMDAYTNLQNRLKLVTGTQQELTTAMNDTFKIAQNTAQAWDSVSMVYQRFADNAKALGITLTQTASLTETVAKAIAVSGASASSAEAALMQFGQALASGVLRGEEFNSIAEQAPALLKAIANGLNVGIGELRAMAADGQITGDVLVKSLEESKKSVDELFGKTDFSIGNSFTQLNNAVIQFTGEAGKASGSATFLSNAIKTLADNLSLVANIAVLGGIALLTKAIATKTVAVKASIATSAQRRAADDAEAQSQLRLSGLELQRTRQVEGLALTELDLARKEYNSARTRTERAAATMRLTQAEVALAIATRQVGIATAADTALQNANAAARSRAAMALGLVGGPIGALVLGVTALSAAYMYFSAKAGEANLKLEEQAKIAQKTDEELRKLTGNDKISAVNDLTAAFNHQNKALEESKKSVDAVLFAIRASSVENEKARKITEDARNGVISYNDAIKLLNKEKISSDLYDKLKQQANQYDENSLKALLTEKALKSLNIVVKLNGNEAQNAANKNLDHADAIDSVTAAAAQASKQLADYNSKLREGNLSNTYETAYMQQGYTPAQARALVEAQKAVGLDSGILSQQQIDNALKSVEIAEKRNKIEDAYNAKVRSSNKSSSKRNKSESDANRLKEQQYQDRERIYYEYATREMKIAKDLENEIKLIKSARFSPENEAIYIHNAQNRAQLENEIYRVQLDQELKDWNSTELQKLDRKVYLDELIIQANADMNDEMKKQAIKSLIKQANFEGAQIKLNKELRIFQAEQAFMTESDMIRKKYELERREIMLTTRDEVEAEKLVNALARQQQEDLKKRAEDAAKRMAEIRSSFSFVGGEEVGGINSRRSRNIDAADELFNSQKIAAEEAVARKLESLWNDYEVKKLITQDEYNTLAQEAQNESYALIYQAESEHYKNLIDIETQYYIDRADLGLSYGEKISSGWASVFKDMLGEQSTAYKTMFAVEKSFAVARALLAIPESYSKAYNAMVGVPIVGPTLAPIAGAAAAALQVAQASQIKGTTMSGFKVGGYTGNGGINDVAGFVHGKEYVLNAEATKRVGVDRLDAVNRGADIDATRRASASNSSATQANVNLNPNFVIVDERANLGDYLNSPDGTKAFIRFFKRNRDALGV